MTSLCYSIALFHLLILVSLSLISAHFEAPSEKSDLYREWEQLKKEVFGRLDQIQSTKRTSELLRRAELVYLKLEAANQTHNIDEWTIENVKQLVEFSRRVKEADCESSTLRDFGGSIENNLNYLETVVPYLRDLKVRFFVRCKSTFVNALREKVRSLPVWQRAKVKKLVDEIVKMKRSGDQLYLETGCLSFLIAAHRIQDSSSISRELFGRFFESSILKICQSVQLQLETPMLAFHHVLHQKELMHQLEKPSLEWIERADTCSDILRDAEKLEEGAFKLLKI